MARRGAVHVVINWMYVLIAGGAFLLILSQMGASMGLFGADRNAQQVADAIESLIEEAASQPSHMETVAGTSFPSFSVETDETGLSRLHYGRSQRLLRAHVVAPGALRGNVSYWVQPFSIVRPAAKLLLLSDDSYRYVLEYDTNPASQDLHAEVSKRLPANHVSIMQLSLTGSGSSDARSVCLEMAGCDRRIGAVADGFGTIAFEDGSYPYYSYGMLFAGVFARSGEDYANAMRVPIERHNVVIDMLLDRARSMSSNDPACLVRYARVVSDLEVFEDLELGTLNMVDAASALDRLERTNVELEERGCEAV